jgi:hypothetical protein
VWAIAQQHCTTIKVLHSDHGGEYLSGAFDQHLAKSGTARKLTTQNTPQLNSIAECLNCTLFERIYALTHASSLPKSLWGEALRHAAWLKNWTATHALDGKTPFEALYGQSSNLSTLCTWGFHVWVHNAEGSKLNAHTYKARWLGPNVDAKAHCIFWPSSGNVTVKQNVYFGTSAPLKGEEENLLVTSSKQTAIPPSPSNSPSTELPSLPNIPHLINTDDNDKTEAPEEMQLQKPQPPPP